MGKFENFTVSEKGAAKLVQQSLLVRYYFDKPESNFTVEVRTTQWVTN